MHPPTENGVSELGRQNVPQTEEGVKLTGAGDDHRPQPPPLTMRTKAEAMTYATEKYPWLSKVIMPDALYRLARDILFK